MEKIRITQALARKFLVAYHSLDRYSPYGKEKGILEYFQKAGSVQFDPLDICGKNAELVLQARIRNFRPSDLYRLLYKKRLLTEGWDKMMCIYNISDYPYFKRKRDQDLAYYNSKDAEELRMIAEKVLVEIKNRGPLSSLDLDFHEKIDWSWAPAKLSRAALEILFFSGKLAIESRIHSRRKYDLVEKLIPGEYLSAKDPNEKDDKYYDWSVKRRLGSIGLYYDKSGDGWLGIIKKAERDKSLRRLLETDEIIPIEIIDLPFNFYIRREERDLMEKILTGKRKITKKITFLAPLDNFMWDRFLIETLFGFQYRWEVYKPAVERKYGYYVLPVLYGDRIIARFEPVRNKKGLSLSIKNWWWEKGVKPDDTMKKSIEKAIGDYAQFLEVETDGETCFRQIFK
ncbi:MAG: YcaQ family DNA glycosylase [Spirochaetaceae bacterium]|nr:YcaQ family DNA glycosylase [Spirochaetaceae bacterium]